MADYYPLIARAISGLDPSAPGESRRALYERARAALIAQLRSVQPPLSESEITRERLSLPQSQPQIPMQDPLLPPTRERTGGPRRGAENSPQQAPGMRGFRDIAADADDLGRAAAQASRAARKTYANVPSPSPEFDRLEPSMENRGADPDAPYSYDESAEEAERYAPPPQLPARSRPSQDRDRGPKNCGRAPAGLSAPSRTPTWITLVLVGAAILWGKSLVSGVSGLFKSSPSSVVEAPKDAGTSLSKPKIPDRVGQPSSADQAPPGGPRGGLVDEDPGDPKGKQNVGPGGRAPGKA